MVAGRGVYNVFWMAQEAVRTPGPTPGPRRPVAARRASQIHLAAKVEERNPSLIASGNYLIKIVVSIDRVIQKLPDDE